jgi:hypothetical protein
VGEGGLLELAGFHFISLYFTWLHLISLYFTWCHFCFTWSHLISRVFMWFHFSSLHFTSRHIVSLISLDFNRFHLVSLYFTCFYFGSLELTWFHVMSLEFTWFHFISLYFTLVSLDFTCVHLVSSYFTWFHFISLCFTWVHLRGESDYKMCIPLLGECHTRDYLIHWGIVHVACVWCTDASHPCCFRPPRPAPLPQPRGVCRSIEVRTMPLQLLWGAALVYVYMYICVYDHM